MSSSMSECMNVVVILNNPMHLVSFMLLLSAKVNSVSATASGGVLAKTSSRSPYSTCGATRHVFTAFPGHVLQPPGLHFRGTSDLTLPHNLKHIATLHVLEFLGACFFSQHRDTSVLQIA